MKQDISNRKDINKLVKSFYVKVQENETLAPFFEVVKDWESHYELLTTFWESSLFLKTKYFGNPLETHVKVDKDNNKTVTPEHFGIWLRLWINTIDAHFQGEVAERAKFRARKMGTFLYMKIFESRTVKDS